MSAARRIRAVVVDDDHAVAGIHTGFLLAHGGFEVVGVAHNGADALDLISAERPDLVLLDIHLPDISGIEVLRAVRNMAGEPVDIIAVTAARELETVRAAMAGGVLHYLVKPFNSQVLLQRLNQFVEHRENILAHRTDGMQILDQDRIDRLLGPRPDAAAQMPLGNGAHPARMPGESLPKGLSTPTLEAVVRELQASGGSGSASDVARGVGLARVSARRYLEYLVSQGHARVAPRYGDAGRPEKLYQWLPGVPAGGRGA